MEIRYVELLKRASTVKDIIEIERNLNEVRTDIERLEGQFKYLSKQIDLSSINLVFYEVLPYSSESQRKKIGFRLSNSLDSGWQGFLTFLVAFTGLWPFIILIVGGVYGFRKIKARRKGK